MFEIGSRIAFKDKKKWKLGIAIEGGKLLLDDNSEIKFPTTAIQVNYFLKQPDADADIDFTKYEDKSPLISKFKSNKACKFDVTLLRCMFFFANHNVFDMQLIKPILKIRDLNKYKAVGLYEYKSGNPSNDIVSVETNKKLPNPLFVFKVFLHELIHSYNFRIDWLKNNSFNPNLGTHGKTFLRWIPIIQSKFGVVIAPTHNSNILDVSFDDANNENNTNLKQAGSKPTYVVLLTFVGINEDKPHWAAKFIDLKTARTCYKEGIVATRKRAKLKLLMLDNPDLSILLSDGSKTGGKGGYKLTTTKLFNISDSLATSVVKLGKPTGE